MTSGNAVKDINMAPLKENSSFFERVLPSSCLHLSRVMTTSISGHVHADVFHSLFTFTHPADSRSLNHRTFALHDNDVPCDLHGFCLGIESVMVSTIKGSIEKTHILNIHYLLFIVKKKPFVWVFSGKGPKCDKSWASDQSWEKDYYLKAFSIPLSHSLLSCLLHKTPFWPVRFRQAFRNMSCEFTLECYVSV